MASRQTLASRARAGLAPFAGAVFVSLVAVLCLTSVVAGLGLLLEADRLSEPEYVSVTDCLVSEDGKSAISLFWSQHARGPARPARLAAHSLATNRPRVKILWPQIAPTSIAASLVDDRIFVAGQEGAIYLVRASDAQTAPRLLTTQPGGDVRALECSPDGRMLLATATRGVRAWSTDSGDLLWQRDDLSANGVSFDPGSRRLVCGLMDGEVIELDAATGRTLRGVTRMPFAVNEVRISPCGRWLACVGYERRVVLVQWADGDRIWQSSGPVNCAGSFRVLSFSPSGRLLVTAAATDVSHLTIWETATGRTLGMLRGHEGVMLGARFVDEGRLVSWGTDGTVRIWDVERAAAVAITRLSAFGPAI
jgi:WD40 repeat protein